MPTFAKQMLGVFSLNDPELSYLARTVPEGANQTFVAGAPVVVTAGLIVEAADPATDVYAFALRAGQNSTGKKSKIVPVVDGVAFYANFLTAAGADNVLAAADLGGSFELRKAAVGPGGATIWFVADQAAAPAVKIVSFATDQILPNAVGNSYAAVGDTNARVTAIVLDSVRSFD